MMQSAKETQGRWCAAGVAFLAFCCFLNSLPNGFVSDDQHLIFHHPYTGRVADWPRIFTAGHYDGRGGYRPVTTLSLAFDHFLNRDRPLGYHLVNVLLHALNSALVFLLLDRLLRQQLAAVIGAAIFAIHPIHVEAVAWISGRAELLAALFFLLAWVLHLRRAPELVASRWAVRAVVSVSLFIALLSKENALVFPVAVILGDFFLRWTRTVSCEPGWRSRMADYATYFGVIVFYFAFRTLLYPKGVLRAPAEVSFVDNPLAHVSFASRILTALKVQGDYLALLVWPQKLCGDYSFNAVPTVTSFSDPAVLVSIALLAVILGLAVWSFRRRGSIWFGLLFYALAIFPASNLLVSIGTIKAERLLYLPSLGFCLVIGVCAAALYKKSMQKIASAGIARAVAASIAVVLLACGVSRTWARNRDWLNDETFWTSTAAVVPKNYKAQLHVGDYALRENRTVAAIAAFRRAHEVDPQSKDATIDLGVALMQSGQNQAAIDLYKEAVVGDPKRSAFRANLGLAYMAAGETAKGLAEIRKACEIQPENPVLHFDLGRGLSTGGDPEAAAAEYRRAIELRADYPEAWNALGAVLIKLHRLPEAADALHRALQLRVDYPDAIHNLRLIEPSRNLR